MLARQLFDREPLDDLFGWNELPRRVRVDSTREDGQSLLNPCPGELPCFSFRREGHGSTGAPGSGQLAALKRFKGHIPRIRHRKTKLSVNGRNQNAGGG